MSRFVTFALSCLALGFVLCSGPTAWATLTFRLPVVDAGARGEDDVYEFVLDGNSISVRSIDFAGIDQRGVLEFDISTLPADAQVVSAVIEFDVRSCNCAFDGSSGPDAPLFGYAGDGVAELADAFRDDNPIGSVSVRGLEITTAVIDAAYVESLLGVSDYFGVMLAGDPDFSGFSFASGELSAQIQVFPATLLIDYEQGGQPGDYNSDGTVDAADYTVWRDGGSPDDSQAGYNLWVSNYGATSSSSSSSSVPEPTTAISLLIACLGSIRKRPIR